MCWVIDVCTSILAVDSEVTHKPVPAPLGRSPGTPGGEPSKVSQAIDSERALYLSPHTSQSQFINSLPGTGRDPAEILKEPYT